MTQVVTVQTDFTDLEQMAQGLVGRVQTNYVILPTGDAVDEGEWAQFEIALHDGSAGLAGVGRCVTLVDNGDERAAHQRYDIVLDSLQFDTHEQEVFQHILALHGIQVEQADPVDAESLPPAADDVHDDAQDADYVDVSEFTGPHSLRQASEVPAEDPTLMASDDEIVAALSNPAMMRPAPGGEANDVVPQQPARSGGGGNGGGAAAAASGGASYARGGAAHALHPLLEDAREEPLSGERVAPTRSTGGAFVYANGIPFPSKPPRPELDASLRVTPAPRPAGWSDH